MITPPARSARLAPAPHASANSRARSLRSFAMAVELRSNPTPLRQMLPPSGRGRWRKGWDSNPRMHCCITRFRVERLQPDSATLPLRCRLSSSSGLPALCAGYAITLRFSISAFACALAPGRAATLPLASLQAVFVLRWNQLPACARRRLRQSTAYFNPAFTRVRSAEEGVPNP